MKKLCSALFAVYLCVWFLPYMCQSVTAMGNFSSVVSSAYMHSMVVKADGSLWAWGYNGSGQLGDGTDTDRYSPVKIMDDVESVSAGYGGTGIKVYSDSSSVFTQYAFTFAVKKDGSLWAWGYNGNGQLGNGTTDGSLVPVKVMDDVAFVSAGSMHGMAVKTDGSLWTWGQNRYGQLGDGTTTDCYTPVKIMDGAASISACDMHSMAVKKDGSLWAWGFQANGLFGDGTDSLMVVKTPVKIFDGVASVSAGPNHTLTVKTDGSLWGWGENIYGQLGNAVITNITDRRYAPVKIMDDVSSACAGADHSMAVKKDGSLWTWGRNHYGQLGDGTITTSDLMSGKVIENHDRHTPLKIMDNVAFVSAESFSVMAVKTDGSLWMWGYNVNARLNGVIPINIAYPARVMDGILLIPISGENEPSDWAKSAVDHAIKLRLVPSFLQSKYTQPITRAEFCALAVTLYENIKGEITQRAVYTDTDDINARKMGALGVISGVGNGKFSPETPLTREQAAVILSSLANTLGFPLTEKTADFSDKGAISLWAVTQVGQVQAAGIMNGVGDNRFSPKEGYTREQSIATMLKLYVLIRQ